MSFLKNQPQKPYSDLEFRLPFEVLLWRRQGSFCQSLEGMYEKQLCWVWTKWTKYHQNIPMMQKEGLKVSYTLNKSIHLWEEFELTYCLIPVLSTMKSDCLGHGRSTQPFFCLPSPWCSLGDGYWSSLTASQKLGFLSTRATPSNKIGQSEQLGTYITQWYMKMNHLRTGIMLVVFRVKRCYVDLHGLREHIWAHLWLIQSGLVLTRIRTGLIPTFKVFLSA